MMALRFFQFFLALVFYWYEFLIRVAPGPMYQSLMTDLQLDAQSFGLLSSSFLLPYALLQIPAGLLLDRVPTGRILLLSSLLCALSTLGFAYAQSYPLLLASRTISGIGSAAAVLACMKIALTCFPKKFFGIFAGVILFAGGLGAISGKLLIAGFLTFYTWRQLCFYLAIAGLGLTALIGYAFDLSESPLGSEQQDSVLGSLFALLKKPKNLCFGLYALLMTAPSDAFAGLWSSVFFTQGIGLDAFRVEILGSMIFFGMALGSPIVTYVDSFIYNRYSFACSLSLSSALAFISLVYMGVDSFIPLLSGCFFYGLFSVYVLAFVMGQAANPVKISGLVSGFINTLSIIGSFSLQTVIGSLMTFYEPSPLVENSQLHYGLSTFFFAFGLIIFFYLLSALIMGILALKEEGVLK